MLVRERYGAGKVGKGAVKRQVDHIPLILCGDFNSEPHEAARHFLLNQEIGPDFVDRVYPEVRVTKKVKSHNFQLRDAYDDAYASTGQPRPSTMIVKEIFGLFLRDETSPSATDRESIATSTSTPVDDELIVPAEHESTYTSGLLQAVREMFRQFAVRSPASTLSDGSKKSGASDTVEGPLVIPAGRVETWLTALHGPAESRDQSGVHHERLAREALLRHLRQQQEQDSGTKAGEKEEDDTTQPSATETEDFANAPFARLEPAALTFIDFLELNIDELQRNPWSVMHDIQQLNVMHCLPPKAALPPSAGGLPFFERTYDYLYFTPRHLRLDAVRAPIVSEDRVNMDSTGVCLPNAEIPSDHLPLECRFHLVSTLDTGADVPHNLDKLTREISERLAQSIPSGARKTKQQPKQKKKKVPTFDAALLETLCGQADGWLQAPAASTRNDNEADATAMSNLEMLRQQLVVAEPDASGRKFDGMLTASVVKEFLSASPTASQATADEASGKALQKQLTRRISQLIAQASS